MKKYLTIAVLTVVLSILGHGQAKKELTVKDYFLAIPTEYIKAPAEKRSAWIEQEDASIGFLAFSIPVVELTGEEGDGSVWGSMQVFRKKGGGVLIGLVNNLCAEKMCLGMMRFLDYKSGNFTDVSDDYLIVPDNDEVIKILREAPAFEKKELLKDGIQVPLALQFNGNDKLIQFIAGIESSSDGGVIAKQYKWNGEAFVEFEYPESPF